MNYNHRLMIFAAMIAITCTAGAQEVYENVDQQGVVEFSDQPSSGAREIDVRPNVVDVAPVDPVTSSPSVPATGAAQAPAGKVQPEVIREGVTGDNYGESENRREIRREAGREAVHKGGHRR
jgi:hypothetical protein